jgi:hypothetical protein
MLPPPVIQPYTSEKKSIKKNGVIMLHNGMKRYSNIEDAVGFEFC